MAMHIYKEYFKESGKDTGIYAYSAKVLNPASGNTWYIQANLHADFGQLRIIEFETKILNVPVQNELVILEERGILRDFVYDMVWQLSKGERQPMKQKQES